MTIRPATPTDLPRIFEIFEEILAEGDSYAEFGPDPERTRMRQYWAPPDGRTYVVEEQGRVVGGVVIKPNRSAGDPTISNAAFLVTKDSRGKGAGTTLGEFVVAEAAKLGYRAMQFNLVVSTNTSAVRLWKRLGFAVTKTLPGAFPHPTLGPVDAYVMWLDLVPPGG